MLEGSGALWERKGLEQALGEGAGESEKLARVGCQ